MLSVRVAVPWVPASLSTSRSNLTPAFSQEGDRPREKRRYRHRGVIDAPLENPRHKAGIFFCRSAAARPPSAVGRAGRRVQGFAQRTKPWRRRNSFPPSKQNEQGSHRIGASVEWPHRGKRVVIGIEEVIFPELFHRRVSTGGKALLSTL